MCECGRRMELEDPRVLLPEERGSLLPRAFRGTGMDSESGLPVPTKPTDAERAQMMRRIAAKQRAALAVQDGRAETGRESGVELDDETLN